MRKIILLSAFILSVITSCASLKDMWPGQTEEKGQSNTVRQNGIVMEILAPTNHQVFGAGSVAVSGLTYCTNGNEVSNILLSVDGGLYISQGSNHAWNTNIVITDGGHTLAAYALDNTGASSITQQAGITLFPAPSNLSASDGVAHQGYVLVQWTNSWGAQSYNIYRSLSSGGPYSLIGSSPSNAYCDRSVFPLTNYYYEASAVSSTYGETLKSLSDVGYRLMWEFIFDGKWGSSGTGDGQFNTPYGIAVYGNTNIFVTDFNNNRIQKFNTNGDFILKWGSSGSGLGQFRNPHSIAINENIYITETMGFRIQKFDLNTNFITNWGQGGKGNGQFNWPCGIVNDSSGYLYVVDEGNSRIQKFDTNGNFILSWGTNGSGDGQFSNPIGIGIDFNNNIYAVDVLNNRVQVFDTNGNFLRKWGSLGTSNGQFNSPHSVKVDSEGIVYVSDLSNRIQVFDLYGNYYTSFGTNGSGDGQFNEPRGITIISSAYNYYIFVVDSMNNRIQRFRRE